MKGKTDVTTDLKPRELTLGDHVRLFDGPFGWAVVRQIDEHFVHLFRPFVQLSEFVSTAGVTPYVGIEEFTIYIENEAPLKVALGSRPTLL